MGIADSILLREKRMRKEDKFHYFLLLLSPSITTMAAKVIATPALGFLWSSVPGHVDAERASIKHLKGRRQDRRPYQRAHAPTHARTHTRAGKTSMQTGVFGKKRKSRRRPAEKAKLPVHYQSGQYWSRPATVWLTDNNSHFIHR